ncbi:MAG TPA: YfhO family protein [Candidatus Kapabacteria bacterium]|nr:YfhO family protein [Candidatus Kapabacteria bacterium]
MAQAPAARRKTTKPPPPRAVAGLRSAKAALVPASLRRFKLWHIALVFLGLTLIFHSAILFGGKFLWEDFVEQEFPFRTLATSSLAQGIIPQWDPYVFAGMPFIADVQVAFWYPFNMLQSLFVSGNYLSPVVMEWFILLHFAVAGFGMYWFSKKIFEIDDWSATFAGIAYGFGGYIAAQSIHQMIVYHIALFPFVAYFFLRGIDSWKHGIIGGLILGAMYLAGHPQSTLYFTFFLALLAVYEIVYRIRNKQGPIGQIGPMVLVRMAIPILIGFGIFAIQFLPSQELANLSRRETITYQNSLDGSLTWGHLLTFVMPRLFGLTNGAGDAKVPYWNGPYYLSWETAIYIGVLPLFFAVMAGLLARKKKYVPFFVGMALLAVTFALGDHFFVYRIFFALPLFDKFRTPARMMMLFSFAASALAGVGLANALTFAGAKWGEGKGIAVRILLVLPWFLALIGAWHATTFLSTAPDGADASIAWAASLATFPVLAMIAITGLHYLGKLRGDLLAFLIIGVTVIELFNYGMTVNAAPEDPRDAYREQPQLVEMLQNDQAKELSRARTRLGNQMVLKRNQGAYDRIQLTEGYDPLVLQRVFPEMTNSDASMDLMNLKWSITPGDHPGFAMRKNYLPRVKLYYQADILPDSQALAKLKTDSTYDYRNRILIEEPLEFPLGAPDPAATARITSYGDNEIAASVKTASNAMLFFSEVWYPSWKAYVDGHPVKLYRAFTSLRAVEVPAGTHKVTLRYESSAFAAGSWITIVTLLLSLSALAFLFVRERRSNRLKPGAEA